MRTQKILALTLIFVSLAIEIAIICCKSCSRNVPMNYLLLLMFTVCEAFIFSYITAFCAGESVLMSAGMTVGMTVVLTAYACCTKTDFTTCGGLFFVLSIAMFFLVAFSTFFIFASWWYPVLSAILVVIYGFFLIYDTQLIAGSGSHGLSYDEYIIGALILYVDIMMIFF